MIKEIDRFQATDDLGNLVPLVAYQEYVDASSQGNPNAYIPGMKSMRTIDGSPVNVLDDDTFEIVAESKLVRRVN